MSPIRYIIAGLALAFIGIYPLPSILRRGRFHLRGPGRAISRRERPLQFWSSVVGEIGIAAFGLAMIGYGLGRLWASG